jgi:uncharacterized protein (UPF0276 family)
MMSEKVRILPQKAGVGLRTPHFLEILKTQPDIGFLEIHSENFFADGGKVHQVLSEIASHYALSFHGVSLSLGSYEEPNPKHLNHLKQLVGRYNPQLVSEHIAWTMTDETYLNDLLPLPYTVEALNVLCRNVDIVQNTLGRQILLENPSAYLSFDIPNQMHEGEFMQKLVEKTNCGILLDINNIYVSCQNMGTDALDHLKRTPLNAVQEVHLAGHSIKKFENGAELRIDTHGDVVSDEVWALYDAFLQLKKEAVPTLIEWDTDIPNLDVLVNEATKATQKMKMLKENKSAA